MGIPVDAQLTGSAWLLLLLRLMQKLHHGAKGGWLHTAQSLKLWIAPACGQSRKNLAPRPGLSPITFKIKQNSPNFFGSTSAGQGQSRLEGLGGVFGLFDRARTPRSGAPKTL